MNEWLKKMIESKEKEKRSLKEKGKKAKTLEEVRSYEDKIDAVENDISEYRSQLEKVNEEDEEEKREAGTKEEDLEKREQQNIEEKRNALPVGGFNPLGTYSSTKESEERSKKEKKLTERYEQRGQTLKDGKAVTFSINEMPEFRSVSLGSGSLINEKKYSREVNGTFNEVSGLIDLVHGVPLQGGESYEKAYEISSGEGDYTVEDGDYHDADPSFGYVSIGKAKITAYTELTDEAKKLPNVDYQAMVKNSIEKSLRKKITKQILLGAGGSNALTGIFNAPAAIIPASSDIEISEIDANTLDKIVFGYGGDEDVEGDAYLILNKNDLAKFAAIRSTDGKKLYKIELNGNTGTISSDDSFKVPFIINSGCPALSSPGTKADMYSMAYGKLVAYEMPIFSDVEVEESRDFKFKTGQIAYRGSVWCGGNTAMYKGFVRVKKIVA